MGKNLNPQILDLELRLDELEDRIRRLDQNQVLKKINSQVEDTLFMSEELLVNLEEIEELEKRRGVDNGEERN